MHESIYIPIRKEAILFYLAFSCISIYSIMEMSMTSLAFITQIRMSLIWIATFCCVCLINEFISVVNMRRDGIVIFVTVLFVIAVFGGWYFGGRQNIVRNVFRIAAYFFDALVLSTVIVKGDRLKHCIKFLLIFCLLLCLINDFVDLTGIVTFPTPRTSVLKKYVIGTKFDVVYLHLNTMVLFVTNELLERRFEKKRIISLYVALVVILGISVYVDCSTGVIGAIDFAFLYTLTFFGGKKIRDYIFNKYTFFFVIILATIILIVLQQIVNIPFLADFVVNTLERDLTLTGRLVVFMLFIPSMSGHWLWGYGLGRAYSVSMRNFGAADAQNLVLQWVLQIGIVPVLSMLLLLTTLFGRNENCQNKNVLLPIVVLLYTYIFLGIGEITLNYNFFFFTILIACVSNCLGEKIET